MTFKGQRYPSSRAKVLPSRANVVDVIRSPKNKERNWKEANVESCKGAAILRIKAPLKIQVHTKRSLRNNGAAREYCTKRFQVVAASRSISVRDAFRLSLHLLLI